MSTAPVPTPPPATSAVEAASGAVPAASAMHSGHERSLARWLWQPNVIVFLSSFCSMVLELVAGRIIAPYVGVSLYTWTGVIGVVLAGISLGNYLGGRLADRWASLRLLGLVFLLGGVTSLGVLAVDVLGVRLPGSWPVVVQILALTAALFFIPCTVLGCISPVVAKLAVRDLAHTGSTVGKIYAFSTAGSIAGTFATGFWLIATFGTHTIVGGVAAMLSCMGLFFLGLGGSTPRWLVAGLALVLALSGSLALFVFTQQAGWLNGKCVLETNYFCIKVLEQERDGHPVRALVLDRLVHSYTTLDDPTKLIYGYEQIYAELTRGRAAALPPDRPMAALFIGGGGYTFPRYIEAVYPGSQIRVVEIDPGVTRVAYTLLGLNPQTGIVTTNEDARLFLAGQPDRAYDLILGDAFNDFSVPYHLTTAEFNANVRRWLAPGGLYMVNLIDGPRRDFVRAYVYTLHTAFHYVYVAPAVDSWRSSPRVTFVVVGSDRPLDQAAIASAAPDGNSFFNHQVLDEQAIAALLAEGRTVMLTDQYAPTEQMLAPVFRGEPAQ